MGEKKNTDQLMSLSKERKLARKKEIAQMKRNKLVSKIVTVCVLVALVAGIGSLVGYRVYRNLTKVVPSTDMSQALTDDGLIKDINAAEYVDLCDYNNITVTAEDVSYTDEDLAADIKKLVDAKAEIDEQTTAAIQDGDKVNIDFVGTIDGVAFEGGDSQGNGYDLTIGSNQFIDDFEEQLIGHKIGDEVTVLATFPEEYEQDPDLAGKEASFAVTVNGIYVAPAFDDAFVTENLSDTAKTAEEYKAYLRETKYAEKLNDYVESYLIENSNVSSYPSTLISDLKCVEKYQDMAMYEYWNDYAMQAYGTGYGSFSQFIGKSEAKYDKDLAETVEPTAKEYLVYQAIAEKENITIDAEEAIAQYEADNKTEETFINDIQENGRGYIMALALKEKVLTKIIDSVK